jgi:methyl-accepting chemotaxis protein
LRLVLAGAVAAVTLVAAGCGSSGSDNGLSAEEWASQFCSAVTTYTGAIKSAATSLKNAGVSQSSVKTAAQDAQSATTTLADDLDGLGKPDFENADEARSTVDNLHDQLTSDRDDIKAATDNLSSVSDLVTAVEKVSGTLTTASSQISSAVGDLKGISDDLKDGFANADSCSSV